MTEQSHRPLPVPGRRLLGIDLGGRRIGVAVGDRATSTATALATIRRAVSVEADAGVLSRLATEQRAGELVVGLPLDMSGGEGAQAQETRRWAAEIARLTGLPVLFRDERLTSERAESRIGRSGRGRAGGPPTRGQRDARRARIDREAAVLILQDELDTHAESSITPLPGDSTAAGEDERGAQ